MGLTLSQAEGKDVPRISQIVVRQVHLDLFFWECTVLLQVLARRVLRA